MIQKALISFLEISLVKENKKTGTGSKSNRSFLKLSEKLKYTKCSPVYYYEEQISRHIFLCQACIAYIINKTY
jgi:hypothetical protein